MENKKITVIFNPNANLGRAWSVENTLRTQLVNYNDVEWIRTIGVGHAIDIAKSAAEHSVDRVIAIGGDGTVHEVINGLMNSGKKELPSIGIVPVGSGNDFAFSLGISSNPSTALEQSLEEDDFPIDIGYIKDSSGRMELQSELVSTQLW